MAQRVRQPVHSITSLAVPIETNSYASAEGRQKEGRGERAGEEEGLAKKKQRGDRERAGEIERCRERRVNSTLTPSAQTPVNGQH